MVPHPARPSLCDPGLAYALFRYRELQHLEPEKLRLEIRDNGRGFDTNAVKRGNGLWSMERRAERMGGKLELESGIGKGTNVIANL